MRSSIWFQGELSAYHGITLRKCTSCYNDATRNHTLTDWLLWMFRFFPLSYAHHPQTVYLNKNYWSNSFRYNILKRVLLVFEMNWVISFFERLRHFFKCNSSIFRVFVSRLLNFGTGENSLVSSDIFKTFKFKVLLFFL